MQLESRLDLEILKCQRSILANSLEWDAHTPLNIFTLADQIIRLRRIKLEALTDPIAINTALAVNLKFDQTILVLSSPTNTNNLLQTADQIWLLQQAKFQGGFPD